MYKKYILLSTCCFFLLGLASCITYVDKESGIRYKKYLIIGFGIIDTYEYKHEQIQIIKHHTIGVYYNEITNKGGFGYLKETYAIVPYIDKQNTLIELKIDENITINKKVITNENDIN